VCKCQQLIEKIGKGRKISSAWWLNPKKMDGLNHFNYKHQLKGMEFLLANQYEKATAKRFRKSNISYSWKSSRNIEVVPKSQKSNVYF